MASLEMNGQLGKRARDVLELWSLNAANIAEVTIGVNRRVWLTESGYLTSAWQDEISNVEAELAVCQGVSRTKGIPFAVPLPIQTVDGQVIVEAFDRIWWMTTPLPGERPDATSQNTLIAVSEGLSEVHHHLRAVPPLRPVQDRRLVDWAPLAAEFVHRHADLFSATDRDAVQTAVTIVCEHNEELSGERQLVHGDPSFPNLLTDPDSSRIVGIVDWQEAAYDSVFTDLAVLGNTIWQRSGLSNRRVTLEMCLRAYERGGAHHVAPSVVLVAMLAAKLQSVVHHGTKYVAGRGRRIDLAEQPRLIAEIIGEIGD